MRVHFANVNPVQLKMSCSSFNHCSCHWFYSELVGVAVIYIQLSTRQNTPNKVFLRLSRRNLEELTMVFSVGKHELYIEANLGLAV